MGKSKDKKIMPREKLQNRGVDFLSDADLISLILGSGTAEVDVSRLAKLACQEVASCLALKESRNTPLMYWRHYTRIKGIGRVKAMQIVAVLELGRRLFGDKKGRKIEGREDVLEEVGYLKESGKEHVIVLYLSGRGELLHKSTVAVGSENMAIVSPREIYESAVKLGAANIILAHNHPSGDKEMSQQDIEFTRKIKNAGEILGIKLLDHIIV